MNEYAVKIDVNGQITVQHTYKNVINFINTLNISTIDILKSVVSEINIHGWEEFQKYNNVVNVEFGKYYYSTIFTSIYKDEKTEEQNIKTQKINSLIQLCQLGVLTKKQVAEQLTTEKIILFKPEEIEAIDDEMNPEQMEDIIQVDEVRNSNKPWYKFWGK